MHQHRPSDDRPYRFKVAARRLGTTEAFLRQRLAQLGALQRDGVTGARRASEDWVERGLLVEVERQFNHPATGWRWYVRIEITARGLDYLRYVIHDTAA